jgi:hypothetical protein
MRNNLILISLFVVYFIGISLVTAADLCGPISDIGTMNQTSNQTPGPMGSPGLENMTANMTAGPQGIQGIQGPPGVAGADNMTMNMTFNMTPNMTANMTAGSPGPDNDVWYLWVNGTRAMTGMFNAGGFNLSNLLNPVTAQDAATMSFVNEVNDSMRGNVSQFVISANQSLFTNLTDYINAVNISMRNNVTANFPTTVYVNTVNDTMRNNVSQYVISANQSLFTNLSTTISTANQSLFTNLTAYINAVNITGWNNASLFTIAVNNSMLNNVSQYMIAVNNSMRNNISQYMIAVNQSQIVNESLTNASMKNYVDLRQGIARLDGSATTTSLAGGNITGLKFIMGANEVYQFDGMINVGSSVAVGIKFGMWFPASSTCLAMADGDVKLSSASSIQNKTKVTANGTMSTELFHMVADQTGDLRFYGTCKGGETAGEPQVLLATLSAGTVTANAGSYIKWLKLASATSGK